MDRQRSLVTRRQESMVMAALARGSAGAVGRVWPRVAVHGEDRRHAVPMMPTTVPALCRRGSAAQGARAATGTSPTPTHDEFTRRAIQLVPVMMLSNRHGDADAPNRARAASQSAVITAGVELD